MQGFDNECSRFYRNVIIYAFVTGSGEEDTTASSFTTSGEQPLETATSEMTGLLLIKISVSFCQGQWHPRCWHCGRFKNVTGVSRNKAFDCKKTVHFSSQNHVLVILLHGHILFQIERKFNGIVFCEQLHDICRCCFVSKAWNFFSLCLSSQMACDQLRGVNLIFCGYGSWRNSQALFAKLVLRNVVCVF